MLMGIAVAVLLFVPQELSKALEDTDVGVMTAAVQVGAGWGGAGQARASRLMMHCDARSCHRHDRHTRRDISRAVLYL